MPYAKCLRKVIVKPVNNKQPSPFLDSVVQMFVELTHGSHSETHNIRQICSASCAASASILSPRNDDDSRTVEAFVLSEVTEKQADGLQPGWIPRFSCSLTYQGHI